VTAIGSDVHAVKFASERLKNDEDISCLLGEINGWPVLAHTFNRLKEDFSTEY
jgi:hypothetical protein